MITPQQKERRWIETFHKTVTLSRELQVAFTAALVEYHGLYVPAKFRFETDGDVLGVNAMLTAGMTTLVVRQEVVWNSGITARGERRLIWQLLAGQSGWNQIEIGPLATWLDPRPMPRRTNVVRSNFGL